MRFKSLILSLSLLLSACPATSGPGQVNGQNSGQSQANGDLSFEELIKVYECAAGSAASNAAYQEFLRQLRSVSGAAAELLVKSNQITVRQVMAVTGCQRDGSRQPVSSASPVTSSPSPVASSVPPPVAGADLRLEGEAGVKTAGSVSYPVPERRGNGGDVVMMFSGGDAGGKAEITTPALMGKYRVFCRWLNHGDSPEMTVDLGGSQLVLPAGSSRNSGGDLQEDDLGVHSLNMAAGSQLVMTVGGSVTGKGNAWIGIDYFRFVPEP